MAEVKTVPERTMRDDIHLYEWIRADHGIHLAQIVSVKRMPRRLSDQIALDAEEESEHTTDVDEGEESLETAVDTDAGKETLSIEMRILNTFSGTPGAEVRTAAVSLPANEILRLRFPDPVWGRVAIKPGIKVLLVTEGAGPVVDKPVYVEQFEHIEDPTLVAIQQIVKNELNDKPTRIKQYLAWLSDPRPVYALFAGEALARDPDLVAPGDRYTMALSYSHAFLAHPNIEVRIKLGEWMWEEIFPDVRPAGEIAIINATVSALVDSSEDMRTLALDSLLSVDDAGKIERPGIDPNPRAADVLRKLLPELTYSEDRVRVQRYLKVLSR